MAKCFSIEAFSRKVQHNTVQDDICGAASDRPQSPFGTLGYFSAAKISF